MTTVEAAKCVILDICRNQGKTVYIVNLRFIEFVIEAGTSGFAGAIVIGDAATPLINRITTPAAIGTVISNIHCTVSGHHQVVGIAVTGRENLHGPAVDELGLI